MIMEEVKVDKSTGDMSVFHKMTYDCPKCGERVIGNEDNYCAHCGVKLKF